MILPNMPSNGNMSCSAHRLGMWWSRWRQTHTFFCSCDTLGKMTKWGPWKPLSLFAHWIHSRLSWNLSWSYSVLQRAISLKLLAKDALVWCALGPRHQIQKEVGSFCVPPSPHMQSFLHLLFHILIVLQVIEASSLPYLSISSSNRSKVNATVLKNENW